MRIIGFTLIELLMTLALASALGTVAVYTHRTLIERNLLSHYSDVWIKTLRFARSYALTTGKQTTICASNDGQTCTHSSYGDGWLVFAENIAGTALFVDVNEIILEVVAALDPRLTLHSNLNVAVSFYGTGHTNSSGRFVLCLHKNIEQAVGFFITYSGRVRQAKIGEIDSCLSS